MNTLSSNTDLSTKSERLLRLLLAINARAHLAVRWVRAGLTASKVKYE